MLTTKDVREVTFSKQVNGYRREEVDVFLDKVEADYDNYERTVRELNAKVHELETQLDESKTSEGSIQSVLLQAQKLADKIIAEAKEKSASIIEEAKADLENFKAKEKELSGAFNKKAEERSKVAKDELDKIIDSAKENRDKISAAVQKTVEKQSVLFNRLKLETAAFKAEMMEKYKKQIELIASIPDSIPTNPEEIAAAVDLKVDDLSDKDGFIKGLEKSAGADAIESKSARAEKPAEPVKEEIPTVNPVAEKPADDKTDGFVVNTLDIDEE